jgi:hypothetical protein
VAFTLPDFNLTMDVWKYPNYPFLGAPDYTTIPCQIYYQSRGMTSSTNASLIRYASASVPVMLVSSVIEVPVGSARYYRVEASFWVHRGFPNEYWESEVRSCDNIGNPVLEIVP